MQLLQSTKSGYCRGPLGNERAKHMSSNYTSAFAFAVQAVMAALNYELSFINTGIAELRLIQFTTHKNLGQGPRNQWIISTLHVLWTSAV